MRGKRSWWTSASIALVLSMTSVGLSACVPRPQPAAAVQRQTPPPWDAPRDTVSYIAAAGLEPLPLDATGEQHIITLTVTVDGTPVRVPGQVGIDRPRALQAAVHTHDDSGQVWLEGKGAEQVTLRQFFLVWGVRLDDHCLGAACATVMITADGRRIDAGGDLRLAAVQRLTVAATSA